MFGALHDQANFQHLNAGVDSENEHCLQSCVCREHRGSPEGTHSLSTPHRRAIAPGGARAAACTSPREHTQLLTRTACHPRDVWCARMVNQVSLDANQKRNPPVYDSSNSTKFSPACLFSAAASLLASSKATVVVRRPGTPSRASSPVPCGVQRLRKFNLNIQRATDG